MNWEKKAFYPEKNKVICEVLKDRFLQVCRFVSSNVHITTFWIFKNVKNVLFFLEHVKIVMYILYINSVFPLIYCHGLIIREAPVCQILIFLKNSSFLQSEKQVTYEFNNTGFRDEKSSPTC